MKNIELGPWLQRFFREYLIAQRNVSPATVTAYSGTFRLLLAFLKSQYSASSSSMSLDRLTPDMIVRFLGQLEQKRGNTVRTRNARLAAIRCFAHYLRDWVGPELPLCIPRILNIPFKRHVQKISGFLSRQEVEAILAATEDTWSGHRDRLLFLLLYNTGARISETLALQVKSLSDDGKQVEVLGKGRKHRVLPLWPQTQRQIRHWIKQNRFGPESYLLPNRFGQRLGRAGAAYQLRTLVDRAAIKLPSLSKRQISPHTFRHATAMSLLEEGVSLDVIALVLGHEQPTTTHLYLEASVAMKKQALEQTAAPFVRCSRLPLNDTLLRFLEDL